MTSTSLPDVLLSAAQNAGCRDQAKLRHALDDATDKRQPLIEAVLDANVVDEETFFSQLADALRMPYAKDDSEPQEGLHNRFPAKLALQVARVVQHEIENGFLTRLA